MRERATTRSAGREAPPEAGPTGAVDRDKARAASATRDVEELAHDLGEGLGTIGLFAGSLERRLGAHPDPEVAHDLAAIRAGIDRLAALITAAMSAGDGPAGERQVPMDANDAVRDARANLQRMIGESGARIVCEPLPWVLGDGAALTRLFQNLLANAIEHRTPGTEPRIRVGARPHDDRWLFEVVDDGPGIDPERAVRALEAGRTPGGGLGLAICARIVAAHGGEISAARGPGGGTTIGFDLARARRQDRPGATRRAG